MSHFSVPRVKCVTLVSSEFSMQNDVFRRSHAVAGLWIAVVDVVCVMFGLGLTVCGAVIGMKPSTPYIPGTL
jgi:hypothetical protein